MMKKQRSTKPHNKRLWFELILCIAIFMLFIPIISAGITDRIKYAPNDLGVEDMKVELKSWWGFFERLGIDQTIGEFELKSHKDTKEVINVGAGNQVTMFYDFNFKELYTNGLGEVIFINMKTGKEVTRDYKFVYEFKEDKTRENCLEYEQILNSSVKGNETYEQGKCLTTETETYTFTEWRDYNSLDIPKGIIRIGVEVNNRNGDYLDGIWTIGGKEISKHASWNASLETGLVSWWKLDETSGTVAIDSHGTNNGTNYGATVNQTGKINTAYDFDGTNDYIQTPLTNTKIDTPDFTICMWINANTTSSYHHLFEHSPVEATDYGTKMLRINSNVLQFSVGNPSNPAYVSFTTTGSWVFVCGVRDSVNSESYVYVNGIEGTTGLIGTEVEGTGHNYARLGVSRSPSLDNFYNGKMDEIGIWSRALSSTEITALYNEGDGCTYQSCTEVSPLTINLTSPANNTFLTTTGDVDFIGEIITETNMTNVSLVVNNVIEQTNTSGLNGTYTFTESLSDGVYVWSIQGTIIENVSASSVNRTLTIDSIDPTLTATINNTILYKAGETILLNTTATDTNLDKVWYSYNGTNTTITGAVTGTLNQTTITTTLDALEIVVYANDTAGNTATPVTLTLIVDPTTPTITLNYPTALIDYGKLNDTLELNITATDSNLLRTQIVPYSHYCDGIWRDSAPIHEFSCINTFDGNLNTYSEANAYLNSSVFHNYTNYKDYNYIIAKPYVYTYSDGGIDTFCKDSLGEWILLGRKIYGGSNLSLAFGNYIVPKECLENDFIEFKNTVVKTNDGFREMVIEEYRSTIDKVWYDYNGTNITIAGAVSGTANLSNITLSTKKNITIYANDTAGNLNTTLFSWDYKLFETSQTYKRVVYETESNKFILNLTYFPISSISAKLNYNGKNYSSSNFRSGTNAHFISENMDAPIVNTTTNKTFYWIINYETEIITTENLIQTINPLIIQQCNATINATALNFTFFDEINQANLNASANATTIKVNFDYWVGEGTTKKSYAFQNLTSSLNNYQFCLNTNETNFIDMDMQYFADGYSKRTYYFRNHSIDNETQDILLYVLPNDKSIKFEIEVRQDISAFTGAIVEVWKYFVGLGEYKEIMIGLTDDKGIFPANIELDQTYQLKIYKDDTFYGTFERTFLCSATPCEINLNIEFLNVTAFEDFYRYFAKNIEYDLTYNSTSKMVYLTFEDNLGTAQYWRLFVYQTNFVNDSAISICDNTSYTVSGSLSCNYTGYTGNSIYAKVFISRSPEKLVEIINLVELASIVIGVSALLASIIIIIVIVFTGVRNPISALVMLLFAIVILKLIGFLPLSWIWIAGFTAFLIWLITRLKT